MLQILMLSFLFGAGSLMFASDHQGSPLGKFDQFVLGAFFNVDQIRNIKDLIEKGTIVELLYEEPIVRGDTSAIGKAIFKKLHSIKNKSRFENTRIDTYSHLIASDGTLKDAQSFTLYMCIKDMHVLQVALQKILFDKLHIHKEKNS